MLQTIYPWLKAVHILAIISWMAGLLYLPRLFVYHAGVKPGGAQGKTFRIMEARLYNIIMMPAMFVAWLAGGTLAAIPGVVDWSGGIWVYVKLLMIVCLTGFHFFLGRELEMFARDKNRRPASQFRMLNEIPTLLMVVIVIMVVVRPF